ncbi:hypothetical protein BB560_001334, partial [Smittium megazygosporum]
LFPSTDLKLKLHKGNLAHKRENQPYLMGTELDIHQIIETVNNPRGCSPNKILGFRPSLEITTKWKLEGKAFAIGMKVHPSPINQKTTEFTVHWLQSTNCIPFRGIQNESTNTEKNLRPFLDKLFSLKRASYLCFIGPLSKILLFSRYGFPKFYQIDFQFPNQHSMNVETKSSAVNQNLVPLNHKKSFSSKLISKLKLNKSLLSPSSPTFPKKLFSKPTQVSQDPEINSSPSNKKIFFNSVKKKRQIQRLGILNHPSNPNHDPYDSPPRSRSVSQNSYFQKKQSFILSQPQPDYSYFSTSNQRFPLNPNSCIPDSDTLSPKIPTSKHGGPSPNISPNNLNSIPEYPESSAPNDNPNFPQVRNLTAYPCEFISSIPSPAPISKISSNFQDPQPTKIYSNFSSSDKEHNIDAQSSLNLSYIPIPNYKNSTKTAQRESKMIHPLSQNVTSQKKKDIIRDKSLLNLINDDAGYGNSDSDDPLSNIYLCNRNTNTDQSTTNLKPFESKTKLKSQNFFKRSSTKGDLNNLSFNQDSHFTNPAPSRSNYRHFDSSENAILIQHSNYSNLPNIEKDNTLTEINRITDFTLFPISPAAQPNIPLSSPDSPALTAVSSKFPYKLNLNSENNHGFSFKHHHLHQSQKTASSDTYEVNSVPSNKRLNRSFRIISGKVHDMDQTGSIPSHSRSNYPFDNLKDKQNNIQIDSSSEAGFSSRDGPNVNMLPLIDTSHSEAQLVNTGLNITYRKLTNMTQYTPILPVSVNRSNDESFLCKKPECLASGDSEKPNLNSFNISDYDQFTHKNALNSTHSDKASLETSHNQSVRRYQQSAEKKKSENPSTGKALPYRKRSRLPKASYAFSPPKTAPSIHNKYEFPFGAEDHLLFQNHRYSTLSDTFNYSKLRRDSFHSTSENKSLYRDSAPGDYKFNQIIDFYSCIASESDSSLTSTFSSMSSYVDDFLENHTDFEQISSPQSYKQAKNTHSWYNSMSSVNKNQLEVNLNLIYGKADTLMSRENSRNVAHFKLPKYKDSNSTLKHHGTFSNKHKPSQETICHNELYSNSTISSYSNRTKSPHTLKSKSSTHSRNLKSPTKNMDYYAKFNLLNLLINKDDSSNERTRDKNQHANQKQPENDKTELQKSLTVPISKNQKRKGKLFSIPINNSSRQTSGKKLNRRISKIKKRSFVSTDRYVNLYKLPRRGSCQHTESSRPLSVIKNRPKAKSDASLIELLSLSRIYSPCRHMLYYIKNNPNHSVPIYSITKKGQNDPDLSIEYFRNNQPSINKGLVPLFYTEPVMNKSPRLTIVGTNEFSDDSLLRFNLFLMKQSSKKESILNTHYDPYFMLETNNRIGTPYNLPYRKSNSMVSEIKNIDIFFKLIEPLRKFVKRKKKPVIHNRRPSTIILPMKYAFFTNHLNLKLGFCSSLQNLLSVSIANSSLHIFSSHNNPQIPVCMLTRGGWISNIPNIRFLKLRNLGLTQIPISIIYAKNLCELDISGNLISELGNGLLEMPYLSSLNLSSNPLSINSLYKIYNNRKHISISFSECMMKSTFDDFISYGKDYVRDRHKIYSFCKENDSPFINEHFLQESLLSGSRQFFEPRSIQYPNKLEIPKREKLRSKFLSRIKMTIQNRAISIINGIEDKQLSDLKNESEQYYILSKLYMKIAYNAYNSFEKILENSKPALINPVLDTQSL